MIGKIYVVWWQYSDKSGMGFVRAFVDQGKGDELAFMLHEYSDGTRQFNCTLVEIDYQTPVRADKG